MANAIVTLSGRQSVVAVSAEAAATYATQAAASASAAAVSASLAEAFSGPVYASTAAGLAATTNGQFFAVNASGVVTVYKNVSGSAVEQRKTLFVDTNGNVGIGTSSPGAKLEVNGSILVGASQFIRNAGIFYIDAPSDTATHGFVIRAGSAYTTVMRILPGGNVGIGASSPGSKLEVNGAVSASLGAVTTPSFTFTGDLNTGMWSPAADTVAFSTGGSERARIDSSGNVGIGTATTTHGLNVANGATSITGSSGGVSLFTLGAFRHTGTSMFYIDTTTGGAAAGVTFRDGSSYTSRLVIESGGHLRPGGDNSLTLGTASFRWSQLYAGTSTINTSDERQKVWRGGIQEAEREAARAIIGELGFYQWADAVAEKGDDARYHFGVKAQRVWAIMAEHGLIDQINADGRPGNTPYAFLCFDEWDDIYEEAPVPTDADGVADPDAVAGQRLARAAGSSYGLRLDQLTLFLLAGLVPA